MINIFFILCFVISNVLLSREAPSAPKSIRPGKKVTKIERTLTPPFSNEQLLSMSEDEITSTIRKLIQKNKAYREDIPSIGRPLIFAIEHNLIQLAKELIDAGAPLTGGGLKGEKIPLHEAVEHGNSKMVKLFLEHNADINAQTNNRDTALHYAARDGSKEIVDLLLKKGADVTIRNKQHNTPLEEAVINGKDLPSLFSAYVKEEGYLPEISKLLKSARENKKMTETIAYLSIFPLRVIVENKLREQSFRVRRLVSDIINREQSLSDYDVFYHAQTIELKFFQDMVKEFFSWLDTPANYNAFEYMRMPGATFDFKQKIAHIIADNFGQMNVPVLSDGELTHLDHHPELSKRLLSTNLSLFGNSFLPGECTLCYFLKNLSLTKITISKLLKDLFNEIGLGEKYLVVLEHLYQYFLHLRNRTKSGNLLQIFIPKDKVNDYVYLAKPCGIPLKTISMKDAAGKLTIQDVTSLGTEQIINFYRNNPSRFDPLTFDGLQARLFLTNTFFLNPASGIKIYSYNTLVTEEVAEYKKRMKALVNTIMTDWATEKSIMSEKLAITNQQTYNHKRNILLNAAHNLLAQQVSSKNREQAIEVKEALTALKEVYGNKYDSIPQLDDIAITIENLKSKFEHTNVSQ